MVVDENQGMQPQSAKSQFSSTAPQLPCPPPPSPHPFLPQLLAALAPTPACGTVPAPSCFVGGISSSRHPAHVPTRGPSTSTRTRSHLHRLENIAVKQVLRDHKHVALSAVRLHHPRQYHTELGVQRAPDLQPTTLSSSSSQPAM